MVEAEPRIEASSASWPKPKASRRVSEGLKPRRSLRNGCSSRAGVRSGEEVPTGPKKLWRRNDCLGASSGCVPPHLGAHGCVLSLFGAVSPAANKERSMKKLVVLTIGLTLAISAAPAEAKGGSNRGPQGGVQVGSGSNPVSYTHLTLPTKRIV